MFRSPRVNMNQSLLWKYYKKKLDKKATCCACSSILSFRSTTANLKSHLRRRHAQLWDDLLERQNKQEPSCYEEINEDSNSSVKFSSEVWANFDQEDDVARCNICQKATENTVEEMKAHLEEDHPAVLIDILKTRPTARVTVSSDAEIDHEEEAFTEVVYLEDDKPRKRTTIREPPKRRKSVKPEPIQEKRIEYTIVNEEERTNPEVDSFLNYISVLLKNVPKETFPKLQLDIISLILNAKMTAPAPPQILLPAQISVPQNQEIITSNGPIRVLNTSQCSTSTASDYHITIETSK